MRPSLAGFILLFILASTSGLMAQVFPPPAGYDQLTTLFDDWKVFQRPAMKDGIPDYSREAMAAQYEGLRSYRERLADIDTTGWPVPARVNYVLLWAEMNGMEFDHRVLRPWERMPGFYAHVWLEQSDVPAHEGPVAYGALEAWQYTFPLDTKSQQHMLAELQKTPRILRLARKNLTGTARDLWLGGIGRMQWHKADIEGLRSLLPKEGPLQEAAAEALAATDAYIEWLKEQTPSKNSPSGIGVENYNWYLTNVQLMPYTWQQEVDYMKSELARSVASLKLEEHRNIGLPELPLPSSAEEYDRAHEKAVQDFISFLDKKEIIEIRDYMAPALRAKVGSISPNGTPPHFFAEIDYRDPLTMICHNYHWIELARMREEPHPDPIRRDPLPYNMFQYRSEGLATAMEEFAMHAGLNESNPRSRELVWMLVAMRASRALSGLYVHANMLDVSAAADRAAEGVPRGWFKKGGSLVLGEQILYLSQPGYGSTYLMGKRQLEALLRDRSMQLGDGFSVKGFMTEFTASGVIPISLIRWEMTGDEDEISRILGNRER